MVKELKRSRVRALDAYLVVLVVILVIFKNSLMGDPGVGWHLKNGELIVSNLQISKIDMFLVAASPLNWVSDQWAADLIMYFLYSIGGFSLLHLGCAVLQVAAYGMVVGREIVKDSQNVLAAFFILALVFSTASIQWFCRPVLFSFLFFAMLYVWMRDFSKQSSLSVRKLSVLNVKVFFLFVAWANLHPGFAASAVIFISSLAELFLVQTSLRQRKIIGVVSLGVIAFLATTINPYGLELHRSILALVSSDFFMNLNLEWLPPDITDTTFLSFFISAMIVILLTFVVPFRCLRKFDLFAALLLLILSMQQRRYISFFAIPMGLFVAGSIREIADGNARWAFNQMKVLRLIVNPSHSKEFRGRLVLTNCFLLFCLGFIFCFDRLPFRNDAELGFWDTFPKAAVKYLRETEGEGSIFATPDWGGFLTWELWPKHKVFIDDRNALIGEQRYRDFFALRDLQSGWEEILKQHDFRFILLSPDDKLARVLMRDDSWRVAFSDTNGNSVLFERK